MRTIRKNILLILCRPQPGYVLTTVHLGHDGLRDYTQLLAYMQAYKTRI